VIPDQLVVHSPKATNNDIKLLFGTTLYDLKVAEMPATTALTVRDGLRLFFAGGGLGTCAGIIFSAVSRRDSSGDGEPC